MQGTTIKWLSSATISQNLHPTRQCAHSYTRDESHTHTHTHTHTDTHLHTHTQLTYCFHLLVKRLFDFISFAFEFLSQRHDPVVRSWTVRGHEYICIRVHGTRFEKLLMTRTVWRIIVLFFVIGIRHLWHGI